MIGEVEIQARILDRVAPGWEHKIDPDTLTFKGDGPGRFSLINDCVLGQVYGSWGCAPVAIRGSTAYLGMCLFGRARWTRAARRRLNHLHRIRSLDLRRPVQPLYVPQEWAEVEQVRVLV